MVVSPAPAAIVVRPIEAIRPVEAIRPIIVRPIAIKGVGAIEAGPPPPATPVDLLRKAGCLCGGDVCSGNCGEGRGARHRQVKKPGNSGSDEGGHFTTHRFTPELSVHLLVGCWRAGMDGGGTRQFLTYARLSPNSRLLQLTHSYARSVIEPSPRCNSDRSGLIQIWSAVP